MRNDWSGSFYQRMDIGMVLGLCVHMCPQPTFKKIEHFWADIGNHR